MKIVSCVVAALLVAGCGLCPTKVIKEPVEVLVPVTVKCKSKRPEAPVPVDLGTLPVGVYDRAMALIREGNDYRLYSKELEVALAKCSDPE